MAKLKERSMGAIFQNRVQEYGDKTLVKYKNKQGVWEEISWNKLNGMVRDMGLFLISKEIQPGDKVALFSPNRYEWWVADLAIISVGAVNVPIYAHQLRRGVPVHYREFRLQDVFRRHQGTHG